MSNRDKFKQRFAQRYPDIDFDNEETKEDRYAAMNDDADMLDQYEQSGQALGDVLDNNRWLGAMLMDLKDDPELDPVTWMANNGVDIAEALENPEYRQKIADTVADFQKKQLESKEAEQQRDDNLKASADNLKQLGLSDEENLNLWTRFFSDILNPALKGEISTETWQLVKNAYSYDSDMQTAREQGGMQARNEKIANQLKSTTPQDMPPTLAQGASPKADKQKKKTITSEFFGD